MDADPFQYLHTPIRHQGGIKLFYQDPPVFTVKAIHQFGVEVITY